jgi:transcriptional regulator with PAS, ATPase and Fis domain
LPEISPTGYLPAVLGSVSQDKSFSSEREILYQVLFDMRKDITELKKLVHNIIGKEEVETSDISHVSPIYTRDDIQDTEEYVEESFSLEDIEKEMIKKALERHQNKRKYAAQDLKISERTLYRKIKEYGLE